MSSRLLSQNITLLTFTPDRIGPVEYTAGSLNGLGAVVTIYHSLPLSLPLPKARKRRTVSRTKPKARKSRAESRTKVAGVRIASARSKISKAPSAMKRTTAPVIPSLGSGIPDTPELKEGYRTMKNPLEPQTSQGTVGKNKRPRLSPEGPYGSWGLSIPPEER